MNKALPLQVLNPFLFALLNKRVVTRMMQRQSLGSPGAKIQLPSGSGGGAAWREESKEEKRFRSCLRQGKSIHLIPVLTLLCLLVLYLFSHNPSPQDLEAFGGGSWRDDPKDAAIAAANTIQNNLVLKTAIAGGGGGSFRYRKLGLADRRARRT